MGVGGGCGELGNQSHNDNYWRLLGLGESCDFDPGGENLTDCYVTVPHSLLVPPTRNLAMACGPSWMLAPLALFRLGLIRGGALSESSEELRSSKCPNK